jgi:hypothetical protein
VTACRESGFLGLAGAPDIGDETRRSADAGAEPLGTSGGAKSVGALSTPDPTLTGLAIEDDLVI